LPPNIPDDPKKPEVLPPNIPDDPKKPEVLPPQEDSELAFEADAVLSDVSQSYEDLISREVDNEINEDWHNTSRYNLLKRGKLFLMR
jgi:hypothetical protein